MTWVDAMVGWRPGHDCRIHGGRGVRAAQLRDLEEIQRPLLARATAYGIEVVPHLANGDVVEEIVATARRQRVQCIVLGRLGRSAILRRASGGIGSLIALRAPVFSFHR